MPRGAPDYSNVRAYGPLHRLDDQAELAARLGSPIVYDRGGRVVWFTAFRHGLQGSTPGTDSAEDTYTISTERSHFGGYSLKLDPGDESSSYVEWGNVVQFIETGKIGLEALISTGANPDAIRLKMYYVDGTTITRAELNYDTESGDWTIRTGDTTWTTVLESFKIQQDATAWNPIKLVIDVETGKYVRMQVAKHVVDLSDYDIFSESSEYLGQLICRVMVYGDAARHAPIYVDAVIVTQNEP